MKAKQRLSIRKYRTVLNVQGRKTNAEKRAKEVAAVIMKEPEPIEPIQPPPAPPVFKKTPPIQKLRSYLKEKFGF